MAELHATGRIFGLGLSRTGTLSLTNALNILGISAIHYPHDPRTFEELTAGHYKLSVMDRFQAALDISVAPFYPQLDKNFPRSKFILSVREETDWLRSVERYWACQAGELEKVLSSEERRVSDFVCACVYGCLEYNEDRFLYAYRTHLRNVLNYFDGRENDLLVIDVCSGEGWEKLCPFLGCEVPGSAFPRSNVFEDVRQWWQQLSRASQEMGAILPPGHSFILVDEWALGGRMPQALRLAPEEAQPDESAIREIERLRRKGLRFLVFLWPAFWWFAEYQDLNRHLRSNYQCIRENECLRVFDLSPGPKM